MKSLGTIPGSTGTTFDVVAALTAGKVGFRPLGSDAYRVRVVPSGSVKLSLNGGDWQQPSTSQKRYSTVVTGQKSLAIAIAEATKALAEQSVQVAISVQ